MNSRNSKFKKQIRGFTLVEIMIVVTIIGILASLAVPAFQRARWKALETSIKNNLRQMWGAAQQYMLETGSDSVDISTIVSWKPKTGDATGTDAGYTSVIQQIANESYDEIGVYRTDTISSYTTDENSADSISSFAKMFYEDTQGLIVKIPASGSGKDRYVKLRL